MSLFFLSFVFFSLLAAAAAAAAVRRINKKLTVAQRHFLMAAISDDWQLSKRSSAEVSRPFSHIVTEETCKYVHL